MVKKESTLNLPRKADFCFPGSAYNVLGNMFGACPGAHSFCLIFQKVEFFGVWAYTKLIWYMILRGGRGYETEESDDPGGYQRGD